jgi:hypothetical protein
MRQKPLARLEIVSENGGSVMIEFCRSLYSWRGCVRWATLAVVLAAAWASSARAQNELTEVTAATTETPYALLQSATITGSGNTITALWVP